MKLPFHALLTSLALASCAPAFAQGARIPPSRSGSLWRSRRAVPPTSSPGSSPEARRRVGQPVVVENRGGAGGNVAAQAVSKAAPDGYTVLVTTSAIAREPGLSKNPGYDVERDLIPVAVVASSPNVIVASLALGANTLQEVVEKAKSGKLNYGTAGAEPHRTFRPSTSSRSSRKSR